MNVKHGKCHTEKEIRAAIDAGKPVYLLDSLTAGEDDILIGTQEEIISDLLATNEFVPGEEPEWQLARVTGISEDEEAESEMFYEICWE